MEQKPILKEIHPIIEIGSDTLQIGQVSGFLNHIPDETGSIKTLLQLLDGTRTSKQIHQELVSKHPEVTFEELTEAITALNSLGYLEDQTWEETTSLSTAQKDRYRANLRFFSIYSDIDNPPSKIQEDLLQKKVTILGSGAFGSTLLSSFAGLGVTNVRIADFDRVELSNLNRQLLFKESDIGRLKIEVAEEFVTERNSSMSVETIRKKISSADDVKELIADSDLVILAADTPFFFIQRWVNTACVELEIPYIAGGVNVTEGTFYHISPKKTPCLDCFHLHHYDQNPDQYEQDLRYLVDSGYHLPTATIAPNLSIITGIIASEACKILTGTSQVQSQGKFVSINFLTYETKIISETERKELDCPTCGEGNRTLSIFSLEQSAEEVLS
ncbi:ThiF family adenylyltransferase [Brevibacillus laterosporus]|uniref:Molybdopterin-synthase adenylyltransferase n=1 Tax=Brevibacillus laterosporus LMG 15441 TaxID=1042163 RepID=A0A075QWJ5_BRELA|nr:ThiF family adenylyltransferase [Brevibacillus laterosporus]HAS01783.1 ThiF family adenylyltransferase [Brevibacillus sp.]AIG24792.1 molybdopterin-synthase adenylyltransferase [Brevibacillus laterosporus LMG 15441]ERM16596.1 thiamin biosynthesis protein [Brevibacillus laterosporus PE36]RJL07855.1 ThiF family adenylyltransferase [Brevibacillus laterosporus]TPH12986.1 ThiF family adenylyltransferase [Brevibacillus laterosporus]